VLIAKSEHSTAFDQILLLLLPNRFLIKLINCSAPCLCAFYEVSIETNPLQNAPVGVNGNVINLVIRSDSVKTLTVKVYNLPVRVIRQNNFSRFINARNRRRHHASSLPTDENEFFVVTRLGKNHRRIICRLYLLRT